MTYKASDIIRKARQLADLTNTDFITWDEEVSLLNDAYTMLYQKLVNIGDGSFVKPFVAFRGENVLPPDFWQIRSVNLVQNKIVTPVKRRADSENYSSLSYEVRFDKLYINGDYSNGEIIVEYWAKPKTLTYKPNPATLNPDLEDRPVMTVHNEMFFTKENPNIYWYDCKSETNGSIDVGGDATFILPCDDQALVTVDSTNKIVTYDGTVTTLSGIPFITESGAIGSIVDGKGKINNHTIFDWDYDTDGVSLVVCNDDFDDFFYVMNELLYHNGSQIIINDDLITANSIMYVNGNCWYYKTNEVGYVDESDELHIVSVKPNCKGINKIDCNTGYGYTIGTTVYPWVEDTVLDFPNSMYFTIMSYMLALQFKIKQGADSSGLMTELQTLENTFYDTLSQDANEPIRIKNVY
jgi:hypothetical protein